MLTPLDIQNKEFNRSFRGYKETEVDSFLDEIISDYESIYKENLELKDKIVLLSEQIKRYDDLEETLKETLIVAQSTADEVTSSARQKAKLIIEEAENDAENITDSAYDEVKHIEEQYEKLKEEVFIFKTRFKSFLESQLITLEDYYREIDDGRKDNTAKEVVNEEILQEHKEDLGA